MIDKKMIKEKLAKQGPSRAQKTSVLFHNEILSHQQHPSDQFSSEETVPFTMSGTHLSKLRGTVYLGQSSKLQTLEANGGEKEQVKKMKIRKYMKKQKQQTKWKLFKE